MTESFTSMCTTVVYYHTTPNTRIMVKQNHIKNHVNMTHDSFLLTVHLDKHSTHPNLYSLW